MRFAIVFFSLLMVGCAKQHSHGLNYVIPPSCLTAPLRLTDCDGRTPPDCKKITADYRLACAILDASKKNK